LLRQGKTSQIDPPLRKQVQKCWLNAHGMAAEIGGGNQQVEAECLKDNPR
jgi:hypothetical protein